jgi:CHAT domain-containing protein/tetratricopeptide (TPR) repeat protein
VRLSLRRLTLDSGTAAQRLQALRHTTHAAELYLQDEPAVRRQALEEHGRARLLWRTLGDGVQEARALYCGAVLARLTGEPQTTIELARAALPLWRELRLPAFEADTLNELGLAAWLTGDPDGARDHFRAALTVRRLAADAYGEAATWANLCLMDLVQGQLRSGAACYEDAVEALEAASAPELESAARASVGHAYRLLGEPEEARRHLQRALTIARQLRLPLREAQTLHNLAESERQSGEPEAALLHLDRALTLFDELEERRWQARSLNSLGLVYEILGESSRARTALEQALELRRRVEDLQGEAHTLTNLGWLAAGEGKHQEALRRYGEARDLWLQSPDSQATTRQQAEILSLMADVHLARRQPEKALRELDRALEQFTASEDLGGRGRTLRRQGEALLALGRPAAAQQQLEQALQLLRRTASTADEARTLYHLALARRDLGDAAGALDRVETAVELAESLRANIVNPHLRTSFSGSFHEAYELAIDLLLSEGSRSQDAGAQPRGSGPAASRRALELAERARARTLVELLGSSGSQPTTPSPLAQRRKVLGSRLLAKTEQRLQEAPASPRRAALAAEEAEILQQLDVVEWQIQRENPAYGALTRPMPLSSSEIQSLLDDQTVLLSFFLGQDRSYLWWITHDSIRAVTLPPRAALEAPVTDLHRAFADFDPQGRGDDQRLSREVADALFHPIAELLRQASNDGHRRLVMIPDGSLHYLPFAALPWPGGDGSELLLDRFEIAAIPSASSLAVLRAGRAQGPPAAAAEARSTGRLAVLADPVFSTEDPRLAPAPSSGASLPHGLVLRGAGDPDGSGSQLPLQRLPATRQEAQRLAELAAPQRVLLAQGFDASRDLVLSGELAGYDTVHFATHGLVDAENPSLSGLLLSRFEADGRPTEGFLGLRDLYNLRLPVDLVVLSGCRTALGRQQRGEGMVGLVRGFFYAGAPRVLASLWPVEDRATAELMEHFYRGLWHQDLPPAAALRQAQQQLRSQRRYRDPAFWAAFVLSGEWREIDRRTQDASTKKQRVP